MVDALSLTPSGTATSPQTRLVSQEAQEEDEWRLARLAATRNEIDQVDVEILKLLNRRATLSLDVGRIKAADAGIVFKPLREREILASLEQRNPGPLPEAHLRAIWREIFSSSRALQRRQKAAYLGPEGTFSYFAGVEYLGQAVEYQPCRHLHDVFRSVHERQCELGVVPLENSLQGTVGQSFDLFHKYPVYIQAELYSRITHTLLSRAASMVGVRRVYSHPQPLAQCDAWLRANLPDVSLIPVESTAAAARRAAEEEDSAAIGHASLADMLSLRVLAGAIEDEPDNWTRFVIIAPVPAPAAAHSSTTPAASTSADKTSLLFTLPDKPGALSSVLETLARQDVNMRKLESRPLKGQCWKYVFFVDVECDLGHPRHAALVECLRGICNTFRILGVYPAGIQTGHVPQAGAAGEGDGPC